MKRQKKVVPRFLGKMTPEIAAALPHLTTLASAKSRGIIKLVVDHLRGVNFSAGQATDMAQSMGMEVSIVVVVLLVVG